MITIAELYEDHAASLRRFAFSLSHDGDQADDLVSETFLQAMSYLQLMETLASHQRKAWLFRVLKNRFIDQLRSSQRQAAFVQQMAWSETVSAPAGLTCLLASTPSRIVPIQPPIPCTPQTSSASSHFIRFFRYTMR